MIAMASGKAPEYGAIFMSNRTTINECFERKLVGLPLAFADFVKEIRAGMVLFIFEYERRKLYGVLKAVTDGKMNIKPNAYSSSGKLFPAQVRFEVIWRCHPLHENEFKDAIKDNYFAPYRFNFGLSKNQVQDLLLLFLSKNPRIERGIRESTIKKQTPLDEIVESISCNRWVPSEEKQEEHTDLPSPSVSSLDFIPLSNDNIDLEETTEEAFSVVPFGKDDQTSSTISPQIGENGLPKVKGLYSDSPGERDSVFSRLVAASKPAVEEKKKKTKSVPSVSEIMEKLETLHGRRWKKKKKTSTTRTEEGKMEKRTSVFSRLNFDSKEEVTVTSRDRERFEANKRKRSREVSIRSQGESLNITIQVQVDGDRRYPNKRKRAEKQQKEEESVPMLETDGNIGDEERWPMFRDRLALQTSTGKENVLEGSTGSNESSNTEIVPALILPPPAKEAEEDGGGGGAAEGKGGAANVGVSPRTILKTYQRRRRGGRISASPPIIKAGDIEAFVDDIRAECMKKSLLLGTTKRMMMVDSSSSS